jgi:Na+-driven multidrug efflux pump
MVFLGFVGFLFFAFAPQLVGAFTRDTEVAAYGIRCLRIVSSGFLFYAYGIVLTQAFNGAGDTLTPTILNLLCFWVFEIPFAYLLARVWKVGPQGAFWAIAVAFSLLAVLSAALFRRGKWKFKRV